MSEEYELRIVNDGHSDAERFRLAMEAYNRGRAAGRDDRKSGVFKLEVPNEEVFKHAWTRGYGIGNSELDEYVK